MAMSRTWLIMPKIFIDADGCPVVYQTLETAERFSIPVVVVCDHAHQFSLEDCEVLYCDQGKDAVDFVILQKVTKHDIVVTQDYGLAALVLGKGAIALSQDGLQYTNENIMGLLNQRCDAQKLRKQHVRMKHAKKRTHCQDEQFVSTLMMLLNTLLEDQE